MAAFDDGCRIYGVIVRDNAYVWLQAVAESAGG
jgi:hypothetical protein